MASPLPLRAAILVVSTTAAQDPSTDAAEATLRGVFSDDGGGTRWTVVATKIVPDDAAAIRTQLLQWTDGTGGLEGGLSRPHLVVTTGGTGFAPSDVTPEAVAALLEKPAPGLVHGMLAASLQVTPFAVMARPVAGVRGQTLLLTLPGSPKGARENLLAVLPMLPHACVLAAGMDSRTLHRGGGVKRLEREAGVAGEGASTSQSRGHDHSHDHGHDHSHSHSHSHSRSHSHGHSHHGPVRHAQPVDASASEAGTVGTKPFISNDLTQGPSRRSRESPYPMISVEEALRRIEEFTPGQVETVRKVDEDLVGFVLAEDVYSPEDVPAYRASIVDGYAVVVPPSAAEDKAASDGAARAEFSGVFPVVSISHANATADQTSGAGDGNTTEATGGTEAAVAERVLVAGEIARITTGAPLPAGANAVVMVENTVLKTRTDDGLEEKEVEIRAAGVRAGDNVREVGSDIRRGALLLRRGEKITSVGGEMGLLAAAGVHSVRVCRRPVVGVLSTGNEVVPYDARAPGALRRGEVRDTNRPTLLLAAAEHGFDTVDLGIAGDQPAALEQRLRDALRQADVILTTGGVSMGELDLLKPTIERALGGTIHFGRVAMKPGKPSTFATVTVKEAGSGSGSVEGDAGRAYAHAHGHAHTHTHAHGHGHARRVVRTLFALPGNPASALVTFHLFVLPALHKMAGEQPRGLPRVPVVLAHDFALDAQRPEYHRAVVTVRTADGVLTATSTGGQRSSKVGSLRGANALLCLPAGAEPLRKGARVDALLMGNVRAEETTSA